MIERRVVDSEKGVLSGEYRNAALASLSRRSGVKVTDLDSADAIRQAIKRLTDDEPADEPKDDKRTRYVEFVLSSLKG